MAHMDTDIAVIGGGSAGLALAYHCLAGSVPTPIMILEARSSYHHDRTWCFWDFGELVMEIDALVRHRWNCWRFSWNGRQIDHESRTHPYCAIGAGDFYRFVMDRISACPTVEHVANCRVLDTAMSENGYLLTTTKGSVRCRRVIDTRPPYSDYMLGAADTHPETVPAPLAGTPMFQVFFGKEIKAEAPLFDPTSAWLLTDMKSSDDGLEFAYLLPFSETSALIELTRFSVRFMLPTQLQENAIRLVARLCNQTPYSVLREEGAVLPMGLPRGKTSQANWVDAGINGGALRHSTGYAFVRTQRWAAHCAETLRRNNAVSPMAPDTSCERFLDCLFLDVLAREPQLSSKIFLGLAERLSPDSFARFMMEKSTVRDYLRMITAMPTVPFLRRLALRTVGK